MLSQTHGLPIPAWMEELNSEIETGAVASLLHYMCGAPG